MIHITFMDTRLRQISGLKSDTGYLALLNQPELWTKYLALNLPFSLLSWGQNVARPEILTPDIWPWIGHFHCLCEARNMDARYLALNRPFSLLSWGQKDWLKYQDDTGWVIDTFRWTVYFSCLQASSPLTYWIMVLDGWKIFFIWNMSVASSLWHRHPSVCLSPKKVPILTYVLTQDPLNCLPCVVVFPCAA